MKEYNLNEAIDYIKKALNAAGESAVADQTIETVVNLIWDGYDELGLLSDIDLDSDDDVAEEEENTRMVNYLEEAMAESGLSRETLELIYKAETEYEDTLF